MLRRGRGRRPDVRIDTQEAYAKYQELGSLEKTAAMFGCSPQTLANRFKANNLIVARPGAQASTEPVPSNVRQQKYYRRKKEGLAVKERVDP